VLTHSCSTIAFVCPLLVAGIALDVHRRTTVSAATLSCSMLPIPLSHHAQAWWLDGSPPDCCPEVPGSNLASPQPTADCQSPGGLPSGMALGYGLTSVGGKREEKITVKKLLVCHKI
jgi:hypothetical protein